MGYIDDNFEYSEKSNNKAKNYKFINMDYNLKIKKIESISSMHQLESMLFNKNMPSIGEPTLFHEKGYKTLRAVFSDTDDTEKVIEKLKEFGKSVLEELRDEDKERKELTCFFEDFKNKVKWKFNFDPSAVGLQVWRPKYKSATNSYKNDIEFYSEVLNTVFIRDGDILIPSFMVLGTAMRTQCRGWHLCCNENLTSAMKKHKEVELTGKNALWWIKKTKEECL